MADYTVSFTQETTEYTVSFTQAARGPQGDTGPAGTTTWDGITDKPATFPTISTDISDSTAAGRAILTAADAAAQRTAMEAQATLVSGTNIKTINGASVLGSGDLTVSGGGENWVFEGDSWTAGTAQGNSIETWPYYLLRGSQIRNRVTGYNVATAGNSAATMVSTFSAQVAPYLTATSGRPSTAFIFAGINDAAGTATQLRDNLRSMWTSARAAGATVVAFTLPHRIAGGGWSQADWATINAQIIADSSYWDHLIRMDILCSNAGASVDFTDGLHVNTAAHERIAAAIFRILNRSTAYPITPSDAVMNTVSSTTFAANTRKNLGFSAAYDANSDMGSATVGSDSGVSQFTVPVGGTYEVSGNVLLSAMASGDNAMLSLWVTPLATGTEAEHRLHYNLSAGANLGLGGMKRLRLLRGDKMNLSVTSSKASSTLLTNANFSTFQVRLVSMP